MQTYAVKPADTKNMGIFSFVSLNTKWDWYAAYGLEQLTLVLKVKEHSVIQTKWNNAFSCFIKSLWAIQVE